MAFRPISPTIKTEITAGLTTFMTKAYIVFVNPAILKGAGIPVRGAAVASCLVAGTMTLRWDSGPLIPL